MYNSPGGSVARTKKPLRMRWKFDGTHTHACVRSAAVPPGACLTGTNFQKKIHEPHLLKFLSWWRVQRNTELPRLSVVCVENPNCVARARGENYSQTRGSSNPQTPSAVREQHRWLMLVAIGLRSQSRAGAQ